jgi:hypothetical protein
VQILSWIPCSLSSEHRASGFEPVCRRLESYREYHASLADWLSTRLLPEEKGVRFLRGAPQRRSAMYVSDASVVYVLIIVLIVLAIVWIAQGIR